MSSFFIWGRFRRKKTSQIFRSIIFSQNLKYESCGAIFLSEIKVRAGDTNLYCCKIARSILFIAENVYGKISSELCEIHSMILACGFFIFFLVGEGGVGAESLFLCTPCVLAYSFCRLFISVSLFDAVVCRCVVCWLFRLLLLSVSVVYVVLPHKR